MNSFISKAEFLTTTKNANIFFGKYLHFLVKTSRKYSKIKSIEYDETKRNQKRAFIQIFLLKYILLYFCFCKNKTKEIELPLVLNISFNFSQYHFLSLHIHIKFIYIFLVSECPF